MEEMNDLQKLDYVFSETLKKYEELNQGFEYKKRFVEIFSKQGYVPNLFTRDNGVREISMSLTTIPMMAEMIKYAVRAQSCALEKRYDENLDKKYPFLYPNFNKSNAFVSPFEYASISKENMTNIVDFFVNQRYGNGSYRKEITDTMETFNQCRASMEQIDNAFGINNERRR